MYLWNRNEFTLKASVDVSNVFSKYSLIKYFDSIALFEKECTLQTFWAFSSRQNSSTQVLLVMVVKHLKDIVSKTEKANLQPLLMVAFPFQQQQRMATQQKTICTFMVSFKGCIALLWHFLKCKNRNVKIFSMNWAILSKFFFTFSIFTLCKLSD